MPLCAYFTFHPILLCPQAQLTYQSHITQVSLRVSYMVLEVFYSFISLFYARLICTPIPKNQTTPMMFPSSLVAGHSSLSRHVLSTLRSVCLYWPSSQEARLPFHSSKIILSWLEALQRASEVWAVAWEAWCSLHLEMMAATQFGTLPHSASPSHSRDVKLVSAIVACGAAHASRQKRS